MNLLEDYKITGIVPHYTIDLITKIKKSQRSDIIPVDHLSNTALVFWSTTLSTYYITILKDFVTVLRYKNKDPVLVYEVIAQYLIKQDFTNEHISEKITSDLFMKRLRIKCAELLLQ